MQNFIYASKKFLHKFSPSRRENVHSSPSFPGFPWDCQKTNIFQVFQDYDNPVIHIQLPRMNYYILQIIRLTKLKIITVP